MGVSGIFNCTCFAQGDWLLSGNIFCTHYRLS